MAKKEIQKTVETLTHEEARRKNIPHRRISVRHGQGGAVSDPGGHAALHCRAGKRKGGPQPGPGPATDLARQKRAGLVRPARSRSTRLKGR